MNDYILHDRLHSRYRIAGQLLVKTPLRISSGVASDETDAPFILDSARRPYIPGTSLRGAVRAELERVIGGIGSSCGLEACTLFSEADCAQAKREEIKEIQKEPDEQKRHEAMVDLINNKVCDLCRLFGNTMFASRIFFEDGHFEQAETKRMVRDGVGIDRDTGAAAPTVKYDYEVIDPGGAPLCFSFGVTVENAAKKDKKIILAMLNLLTQGIYLGGKRAGGLGFVALKGEVKVTGFEKPEDGWKLAIDGGAAPLLPAAIETWKKEVFAC